MTTATATTQLSTGTWAIDPVHSSIEFSVRHLMVSKVRGQVTDNLSERAPVPDRASGYHRRRSFRKRPTLGKLNVTLAHQHRRHYAALPTGRQLT